jgi:epoxyqueuosine reductase
MKAKGKKMNNELAQRLQEKAHTLGFTFFGAIPAQPARRLDAYLHWIEQERYGSMGYMARPDRISRRQDLNVILPGVQTILCVGLNYFPGQLPPAISQDPSRGRIANYAWGVDYHDVMTPRLQELAAWLQAQTDNAVENRVYVDTGAILERDHGETAVFGFTGKNTMLINPKQGSWFFLGEILTTLPLSVSHELLPENHIPLTDTITRQSQIANPQSKSPSCGTCQRCQVACPTDAFPQPYVVDARRCISYLTIELKDWIPRELRPLMGNWIYGCDICQEVCPFNRFATLTEEAGFYSEDLRLKIKDWQGSVSHTSIFNLQSFAYAAPALLEILALDDAGFQARFAHSPIKRIKRERLVRNACVAAGNWGSETAVPFLATLLSDPAPIIRGHAAWALHQIDRAAAKTAVAQALVTESNEQVRQELFN